MNSQPDDRNLPQRIASDEGLPALSEPAAKSQAAPDDLLQNLREQLQELRQRFEIVDTQLAGYLREQAGASRNSAGNGAAMAHIQQSVDRLLARFEELAPRLAVSKEHDSQLSQVAADHQQILDAVGGLAAVQNQLARKIVGTLEKRLAEELDLLRFQQIVHETLTTEWDRREANAKPLPEEASLIQATEPEIELQEVEEEPATPPETDSSDIAWSRAIWGPELVEAEGFHPFLNELNRRLLAGDAGVANLAGQLLLFRQSPSEAKPQLLKDVGEAYYRTRLDAGLPDRPFERAIISWLHAECERAGLPNTIEVVHVGERFDKSRHSSTTRGGAEVAEVFGWVVLTEGGRVYTRASVAAH